MGVRYTTTASTYTTTIWNTNWQTLRPELRPLERNFLLQRMGYPIGIPWNNETYLMARRLVSYGYLMTYTGNSTFDRDYIVTDAGKAALNLRIEDCK